MTSTPCLVTAHLVVDTFVVYNGRTASHFEIQLAVDDRPSAPRLVLITQDETTYIDALSLEGTDVRVDAAWRIGRRPNGKTAQLLVELRKHEAAA